MVDQGDYEIVSQKDLDELRKEIAHIKKNPFGESNRGQNMIESMDRLEIAITKLVRILEDAQTDIIAEYQESKPAEKISQILDQNETIARALLTINEGVKSTQEQLTQLNAKQKESVPASSPPTAKPPQSPFAPQGNFAYGTPQSMMPPAPQSPFMPQGPSPTNMPQNPFMPQQSRQSFGQSSMNTPLPSSLPPDLPPLDNLLPFGDLPPLNDFSSTPSPQKKKILGFI
ncbi:MAG: hypothetical protein WC916_02655 [Candidatus Woesearchaeota archaeon]